MTVTSAASHFNCEQVSNHSPLLFQAFGFINLVLWVGNLWFVFKETGIIAPFMRAPPPQGKPAPDAYDQQGAYEQDPYASNQGGYQPNYSQQGYNQVIRKTASVLTKMIPGHLVQLWTRRTKIHWFDLDTEMCLNETIWSLLYRMM